MQRHQRTNTDMAPPLRPWQGRPPSSSTAPEWLPPSYTPSAQRRPSLDTHVATGDTFSVSTSQLNQVARVSRPVRHPHRPIFRRRPATGRQLAPASQRIVPVRSRRAVPSANADRSVNTLDISSNSSPTSSSSHGPPRTGLPGVDFPALASIPNTGFSCSQQLGPGYYADTAEPANCQVFHICYYDLMDSFLCPNGTLFSQFHLICDWWYNVDCSRSEEFYPMNRAIAESMELVRAEPTPFMPNPTLQALVDGALQSLLDDPLRDNAGGQIDLGVLLDTGTVDGAERLQQVIPDVIDADQEVKKVNNTLETEHGNSLDQTAGTLLALAVHVGEHQDVAGEDSQMDSSPEERIVVTQPEAGSEESSETFQMDNIPVTQPDGGSKDLFDLFRTDNNPAKDSDVTQSDAGSASTELSQIDSGSVVGFDFIQPDARSESPQAFQIDSWSVEGFNFLQPDIGSEESLEMPKTDGDPVKASDIRQLQAGSEEPLDMFHMDSASLDGFEPTQPDVESDELLEELPVPEQLFQVQPEAGNVVQLEPLVEAPPVEGATYQPDTSGNGPSQPAEPAAGRSQLNQPATSTTLGPLASSLPLNQPISSTTQEPPARPLQLDKPPSSTTQQPPANPPQLNQPAPSTTLKPLSLSVPLPSAGDLSESSVVEEQNVSGVHDVTTMEGTLFSDPEALTSTEVFQSDVSNQIPLDESQFSKLAAASSSDETESDIRKGDQSNTLRSSTASDESRNTDQSEETETVPFEQIQFVRQEPEPDDFEVVSSGDGEDVPVRLALISSNSVSSEPRVTASLGVSQNFQSAMTDETDIESEFQKEELLPQSRKPTGVIALQADVQNKTRNLGNKRRRRPVYFTHDVTNREPTEKELLSEFQDILRRPTGSEASTRDTTAPTADSVENTLSFASDTENNNGISSRLRVPILSIAMPRNEETLLELVPARHGSRLLAETTARQEVDSGLTGEDNRGRLVGAAAAAGPADDLTEETGDVSDLRAGQGRRPSESDPLVRSSGLARGHLPNWYTIELLGNMAAPFESARLVTGRSRLKPLFTVEIGRNRFPRP